MANQLLGSAKKAKNDEFYTQFHDIEKEMNAYLEYGPEVFKGKTVLLPCDDPEWSNFTRYFAQNFDTLGLKKLISTSYAPNSKPKEIPYQPTLFEIDSPEFDETKTQSNGKIFTLSQDITGDKVINVEDLEWDYLDGDGDFRSDEIKALRDEADIIITNPPFSLFRGFLAWIIEADKKFLIIGNLNAITYKEVYPLIKHNRVWLGNNYKVNGGAMFYEIPEAIANLEQVREIRSDEKGNKVFITRVQGVRWFTNLDHGRRHEPLSLMTENENTRFSRNKEIKGVGYRKYDNYDAIEVPRVNAIPRDYEGVMGVPISFLDKFSPEQFEILAITKTWDDSSGLKTKIYPTQIQVSESGKESEVGKLNDGGAIEVHETPSSTHYKVEGKMLIQVYARILIRHRRAER
jgi:hypothetical protein